jgi:hypothetical protein
MAITYELSITQTIQFPGGDYLGGVLWQMTGTDGANSSSMQGLVRFDLVDVSDSYVPFEDLTNETIIGWTKDKLGQETLSSIEKDIAEKIAAIA